MLTLPVKGIGNQVAHHVDGVAVASQGGEQGHLREGGREGAPEILYNLRCRVWGST